MIEERTRIARSWHDYKGGLTLYLTRHDEGAGPVYRVENLHGTQLSWNNEAEAKSRAAALLREDGHTCSADCKDWEQI
jgi:hypothetical protein